MSHTDLDLLERYARQHAEDAFAELVRRHLGLVYSAAVRQVRSPQLAEEVAQSVFIDLARNAARLKPGTLLTAWLKESYRRRWRPCAREPLTGVYASHPACFVAFSGPPAIYSQRRAPLRHAAWNKMKSSVVAGAIVLLLAGGTVVVQQQVLPNGIA